MKVKKIEKKDIPMVLYFYLHSMIGEPAFKNIDCTMSEKEARSRMFQWKIPKELRPALLKVWEQMEIIKRINRRDIQFIPTNFDVNDLRDINKFLGVIH